MNKLEVPGWFLCPPSGGTGILPPTRQDKNKDMECDNTTKMLLVEAIYRIWTNASLDERSDRAQVAMLAIGDVLEIKKTKEDGNAR
jgi:hypothetical protein